jgi:hypothetical protein
MDTSLMNGLEIANTAATVIEKFAPFITQGLQLGLKIDPTLGRQLQGAMDLANAAFSIAAQEHAQATKDADERLNK